MTLLVARVRAADHANDAVALDDFAVTAHALYRCHHFHDITLFLNHFARNTIRARDRS
ncbi:hypothetical protein PT2222_210150 [Paraburkholderia tropica]